MSTPDSAPKGHRTDGMPPLARMKAAMVPSDWPIGDWLSAFKLMPEDFTLVGHDLRRPECVVALRNGAVLASNKDSAITLIRPDGTQFAFGHGVELSNTFTL